MNLQRELVIGPGHSLNELIARLFWISECNGTHNHPEWELYPGVFGLYARHSDDWVAISGYRSLDREVLDQYNDVVRCATTAEPINNFNKNHFYVNVTYDVMENIYKDVNAPVFCSYLDMENYPETRYHFAMMEFSEGAAEHLDYSQKPTLTEVAQRCRIKHETETSFRNKIDVNWVSVGKLLQKDYSDLPEHMSRYYELFDEIIDEYKWQNRIEYPLLRQLVDLDWKEVLDL